MSDKQQKEVSVKTYLENNESESKSHSRQFSTFTVDGRLYGIDVMKVQEITKALPMARVPLAPVYVKGLINLRGQISTANLENQLIKHFPFLSLRRFYNDFFGIFFS